MAKAKYNVLMMRDNSPVKRYRLSPTWLKLAVYCLLLLCCAAGLGGYFGFTFWTQNSELQHKMTGMERELREARIELERLQNIDQILKSNDPEELQSLFGTVVKVPQNSKKSITPPPPPINLSKLFSRVDMQQVRVDNVQLKSHDKTVDVSFHLNNLQTEDAISGRAVLTLVTNDGKDATPQVNKNDLVFQIQRFKQISTTFNFPRLLSEKDIFGLRLQIMNSAGKVIFSDTYPLANVQS